MVVVSLKPKNSPLCGSHLLSAALCDSPSLGSQSRATSRCSPTHHCKRQVLALFSTFCCCQRVNCASFSACSLRAGSYRIVPSRLLGGWSSPATSSVVLPHCFWVSATLFLILSMPVAAWIALAGRPVADWLAFWGWCSGLSCEATFCLSKHCPHDCMGRWRTRFGTTLESWRNQHFCSCWTVGAFHLLLSNLPSVRLILNFATDSRSVTTYRVWTTNHHLAHQCLLFVEW